MSHDPNEPERTEPPRPRETKAARRERLAERVRTLPTDPGCYIMKDRAGGVFYVGKASNLRSRVRSYFSGADTRQFVAWLDDLLFELDYMVVRNEKEALLLERTLIRTHQPRFNVKLRDDKNFIHLRLELRPAPAEATLRRRYPRVEVVRGPSKDGARTFGPYHSATGVRSTLRVLNRYFQLRNCRDSVLENRVRPCLQHQIGRCPAPCVYDVPDYTAHLQDAALFLSGRTDELAQRLKARMLQHAENEAFELAARARDQMQSLAGALDNQAVLDVEKRRNIDVVAALRKGDHLVVVKIPIRNGSMQVSEPFHFSGTAEDIPTEEFLSSFLSQLYGERAELLQDDTGEPDRPVNLSQGPSAHTDVVPDELYLNLDVGADADALAQLLTELRGQNVTVRQPQRGHGRRLMDIAEKNAEAILSDHLRKKDTRERGLQALAERLGMARPPRSIECFDISLFQGTDAVASQVCFVDGEPDKSRYRRYTIKTVEGTNDFAMMHETLVRRFKRGHKEGDLPDVMLIDGGKGQLAVAVAAARDTGTAIGEGGVYLCSVAKARSFSDARPDTPREERPHQDESDALQMSPERLFLVGQKDPFVLKPHTAERFLIERLRDEAHRFAITAHRGKRKRRTLRSVLDDIPGVGPKKRQLLLQTFGSVDDIRDASIDALAKVPGINKTLAHGIKAALGGELVDPPGDDSLDQRSPDADSAPDGAEADDGADDFTAAIDDAFDDDTSP